MHARILFLLCASASLIIADYSNEAKYIDLLPEGEKKEFLNRIARRILAEIRTRSGADKTSVEISDERLNENDAYVKQIIDEESADMKNERRTEDIFKKDNHEHVDSLDLEVKPLKKNDPKDEETLENVDLSATENKIRIKKGTSENNTQISKENKDKIDDTFSTVPVHLLYDDEGNSQTKITTKKQDNPKFSVYDLSENNNQTLLENTVNNSNNKIKDLNIESKDNRSKDQSKEVFKNERSINSEKNGDSNSPKAQTIIYDFDPKQDEVTEYKNDATEKSSEIVRAKQFVLDDASEKWIEIPSQNFTENSLNTSSVINNVTEFTVNNEVSTVGTKVDTITNSETNYTGLLQLQQRDKLYDYLSTSESTLKIHDYSVHSNLQNLSAISPNKSVELDVNVTESNLQPATPTNIYDTDVDIKDKAVASTIKVRSVSKEEKNEGGVLTDRPKSVLRLNEEDLKKLNERLRLHSNPHTFSSNDNRDTSPHQAFEVALDKPYVLSKQTNPGIHEAPYFVPVYNYAPSNAFYYPYNRFGPNIGKNREVIESENPYNSDKEKGYELFKFNLDPTYERVHSSKSSKKIKKDRGQRTLKHYQNDDRYQIDHKILYQNKLQPVMNGKFINIHFNPNDYLDMDYYLGRSNDNPKLIKEDVDKEKPFQYSFPQDKSGEPIDPLSKQPFNMKNIISNIRMQVNSQKMDNKSRTTKDNNQKLKEKLKIVDKILGNPMFKSLNHSLVVFIPKTRTKDIGAHDIEENNIAVDYYFNRMSSGERDDKVGNKEQHKDEDEITELLKKHILKTETQDAHSVIEEQQLKIPLKIDNVLKIDLEMKDNNVDVLLQKVKKPKPSGFQILLNAYLSVLKDMVDYDNKGLVQYDWLASAVDVQSALEKMISLSNIMHDGSDVHHSDRELFRYVLFMFKSSLKSLVDATEIIKTNMRRGLDRLAKRNMLPDIDILHRFEPWREARKYMKDIKDLKIDVYDALLKQFAMFLSDWRVKLDELHEVIQAIAAVTKYNQQQWYLDLKALYLTPLDRKVSLTLLLHLVSARLFGLIEESAHNGLEDNFMEYIRTHKMEVQRTREEFVLVLRLLKELHKLKK